MAKTLSLLAFLFWLLKRKREIGRLDAYVLSGRVLLARYWAADARGSLTA